MTEINKSRLLELFCKYPLSEIMNSKTDEILSAMEVAGPEQLCNMEGYGEYYKQVSDIAGEVEKIAGNKSQDLQTKNAIIFFGNKIKTANTDTIDATDKIINSRLFKNWDQQNQKRYVTGKQLLLDWIHFFISYTNSSKPSINYTYKSLLRGQLGADYINDNKERMNLIAALIYKFFKTQRMNTFYDKEKIDWSDNWNEKIFSYTAKSFAFVQFIEPDIFYGTSANNYCYKEYLAYTKSVSDFSQANQLQDFKPVYFFIISNPSNSEEFKFKPAGLDDPELDKWADYIKGEQYITLHTKMSDDELQLKIQEASYKIVGIKKSVFEKFLNTF